MSDLDAGTGGGLFHDEQGNRSAARVLLGCWLGQSVFYVGVCVLRGVEPSNPVLAMDTAIATALIAWAAGPRIAQYIGGQIGAATSAVGQSLRALVAKRRDPATGVESSE